MLMAGKTKSDGCIMNLNQSVTQCDGSVVLLTVAVPCVSILSGVFNSIQYSAADTELLSMMVESG